MDLTFSFVSLHYRPACVESFNQDIMEFNCPARHDMEFSEGDSSEEDSKLPFWNNWLPMNEDESLDVKVTKNFLRNSSAFSFANRKRGNWIPPMRFSVKSKAKRTQERNVRDETFEETLEKSVDKEPPKVPCFKDHKSVDQKKETSRQGNIIFKRDLMFSWVGRMQLCDITKFNDGDLIWGIVNLGVFCNIKLWVNDYGNICVLANGKFCKVGSTDTTIIVITEAELLRKMLCLSSAQWVSLCETVQQTKTVLKFDAFEVFRFTNKTALEKLWFFICKRRHFLPDQFMLVKLSGAVKCMRKFNIALKVVVQEIRNFEGQSVL